MKPAKVARFGEVMIELMLDDLPANAKASIARDRASTAVSLRRVLEQVHSVD